MAKKKTGSHEAELIEERSGLRAPIIYEVVRQRGEEELARPVVSLWWSGIAAGISISFSVLGQGILELNLPSGSWAALVASLGYAIGFLMVILGRQQLFTENTITPVLPLMAQFSVTRLGGLLRMWAIVWIANTVGTLVAALFCSLTPVISHDVLSSMLALSDRMMAYGRIEMFFRAVSAGFIVAALVWLIPSAEAARFWIITVMAWLIAAGGFVHIVAGSVEAFLLVVNGRLGVGQMLVDFTLPALCGNIVGGTALFALLSHAQVMKEI